MNKKTVFFLSIVTGIVVLLSGCSKLPAKRAQVVAASTSLAEWHQTLPVDNRALSEEGIRGLTVAIAGSPVFSVSKEPRSYNSPYNDWAISVPYKSLGVVDTEQLFALFRQLALVPLEQANATESFATQLFATPVCEVTVYSASVRDQEQPDGQQTWLLSEGAEDSFLINKEGESVAYQVSQELLAEVTGIEPAAYLLSIPALVDIDSVASVEIKGSAATYVLEPQGYRINRRGADEGTFKQVYRDVMGTLNTHTYGSEQERPLPGEPELTVSYFRKKADPDVVINYYLSENETILVEVNGHIFFATTPETIEALLRQLEQAYQN